MNIKVVIAGALIAGLLSAVVTKLSERPAEGRITASEMPSMRTQALSRTDELQQFRRESGWDKQ